MKKSSYVGGLIIVIIGLLFVFAAIGFDIKKYIFFPGWVGVVVLLCGIWDIFKDKDVPRGLAISLIGVIIFLNMIGLVATDLAIGLGVVAIGLGVLLSTFMNKVQNKRSE